MAARPLGCTLTELRESLPSGSSPRSVKLQWVVRWATNGEADGIGESDGLHDVGGLAHANVLLRFEQSFFLMPCDPHHIRFGKRLLTCCRFGLKAKNGADEEPDLR